MKVFPSAASLEVLRAVLALTGLTHAVVAVPRDGLWQIETSSADAPGHLAVSIDREGIALFDAIREAGELAVADAVVREAQDPSVRPDAGSYLGIALRNSQGECIGVLCAYGDRLPGGFPVGILEALRAFARGLVAQHSAARGVDAAALASQRKVLSVIGHDVRNPMHSLLAAIEMLKSKPLDPRAQRLTGMVEASALRLGELAKGVVDFARLQLVGDLALHPVANVSLQATLDKVITDVRAAYPLREIEVDIGHVPECTCDTGRLGEAFGAILSHALKHVEHERRVVVHGSSDASGDVVIIVTVPGYILPAELVPHLFNPFYMENGEARIAQLGISLYLAEAVARAHNGSLVADAWDAGAARFTLRVPNRAAAASDEAVPSVTAPARAA